MNRKVILGREATRELPGAKAKFLTGPLKFGAIAVASAAGLALVAFLFLVALVPPGINVAPDDAADEIRPDSQYIEINTSRWGASLGSVMVKEALVAPDGSRYNERLLDGHVQEGGRFVLADGSSPLQADAEYTVTVTGTVKQFDWSGARDERVEETHTFTTVTTPMPVVPAAGLKVKYGEDLTIEWNIPIKEFEYRLEGIENTMELEDGGRVAKISLAKFEQGKEYPLRISSATSSNGRELKAPVVATVKTAAPLTVAFTPADGTVGASTDSHPALTFSEPVSNPEKAQGIVTVEPKVKGQLKWTEPTKLEFVPETPWEHLQDVTVTIKGGPQQLRGVGGGFVESDISSTFTTAPSKSIDVNVATQTMTLFENGQPVRSISISSGQVGLDTPLGDYTIYAKLPSVDMRGPGYFAPGVPWVMVFKGDFTIHGNYWATAFGRRGSHGCVGMPVETARQVYDWTPMGTPVHIHE